MIWKNDLNKLRAFTIIEIIVSVTIFSIIFISVFAIFSNATDLSNKSDLNRIMQENIKNIVETIAEDVRKNGIRWISDSIPDSDCSTAWTSEWLFTYWTKLCTNLNEYYLEKSGVRVWNSDCGEFSDHCIIVKNWEALSNSSVSIKNLDFYLSDILSPKVTINMTIQPSHNKWVKPEIIKENKIIFQTTITTRQF